MKTAKLLSLIAIFCFSTMLVGCGKGEAVSKPETFKTPGDPEPPLNTITMQEEVKKPPVD